MNSLPIYYFLGIGVHFFLFTVTYSSHSLALLQELDTNYKTHFPTIFRYGYHVANNTDRLDCVTEMYKCHYFGEKNISQDIHGFANVRIIHSQFFSESTLTQ